MCTFFVGLAGLAWCWISPPEEAPQLAATTPAQAGAPARQT
jgi:hypothetical protein